MSFPEDISETQISHNMFISDKARHRPCKLSFFALYVIAWTILSTEPMRTICS